MFSTPHKRRIELDYYYTPDGVKIDLHNGADFYLLSTTGTGMPPIRYIQSRGPLQHGATIVDYRIDPRLIQMVFRRETCDRIDYWDARANILDILRPNRQLPGEMKLGTLRKMLSNGRIRDIDVTIQQGPQFVARDLATWDEVSITETILFIAPDPTFYDPVEACYTWTLGPVFGGLIFPFTFPFTFRPSGTSMTQNITYVGNWPTFPAISILGPVSHPRITNTTTGESIYLNRVVISGETITIGLDYGNKSAVSDLYGNVMGYIQEDFATFHIAPHPEATNGVNVINVTGSSMNSSTLITLSYKTRYIGI